MPTPNAGELTITLTQLFSIIGFVVGAASVVVGLMIRNAIAISAHELRIATLEIDRKTLKEDIARDNEKIVAELSKILDKLNEVNQKVTFIEGRDSAKKEK